MSVRVTLNCRLKPNQFNTLLPFLEKNLPNTRSFPGNTLVKVLFDEENNEMLLDEEWLAAENHHAYMEFIGKNGVLAELGQFLAAPPAIKYFRLVDI